MPKRDTVLTLALPCRGYCRTPFGKAYAKGDARLTERLAETPIV